jgi:phosphoglycerate dehydrogenase-like enzyme
MSKRETGNGKFRIHIMNNPDGEMVFRVTPARLAEALARNPDVAPRVEPSIDWGRENFDRAMHDANALITWNPPTGNLAERAPKLKWIHAIGAGVDHLLPLDWLPPGVTLVNNSGVHAPKAGEFGVMAVLMLNQHMPCFYSRQRAHAFEPVFSSPVPGKTLGIVGVGEMGGAVARRARKLGLKVIGVRRHGRPSRWVDEMFGPEGIDEVLRRADFVLVTTPLTPETENLIDRRRLGLMKPGAGLINMGRARIVDYEALAGALRDGSLSGAILDVFDPEPLPPESPLWDTPNLIMTPHVSSDDDEAYIARTLDLFFDNLRRHFAGKPLRNRVRPKLGY